MCCNGAFIFSANRQFAVDPAAVFPKPSRQVSSDMWRIFARRASSLPWPRHFRINAINAAPDAVTEYSLRWRIFAGFQMESEPNGAARCPDFIFSSLACRYRGFSSVAEEVSPTDEEEIAPIEGFHKLIDEIDRELDSDVEPEPIPRQKPKQKSIHGLSQKKYFMLRRRQIKIETEAWEQAAKEYRELMVDMCEQKLAPNLPYMKSLFLGWFEPLRNKIEEDQKAYRDGKSKAAYGPFFDQLPAEMMSVITMHKLMGLLMTGGGDGSARVIQAACAVGEAVEQEARIQTFLEKTKKKTGKNKGDECEQGKEKDQEFLRKRVTKLMMKQKLPQVQRILKKQEDFKPWGQDAHAKVGSRLIELLIETAYIQPPINQQADGPPDIRPAFIHSFRTIAKEQQKSSRRYGVIECDPLVKQGLDRTARHMVIPYMPMLVPPVNWTGTLSHGHLMNLEDRR